MRKLFLLVPSMHPAGPVKGAIALANALADERDIALVALKGGPGADAYIDPRIKLNSLKDSGSFINRLTAYRKLLRRSGNRKEIASISFCFSADMTNMFCHREAVTCASIRGNLLRNYMMDYGPAGIPLALSHLVLLRRFDQVVTMTSAMAKQVSVYSGKPPVIIGNFVDEIPLEEYRSTVDCEDVPSFIFLASLSHRKCPLLLLRAFNALRSEGIEARLDIIGSGPLRSKLLSEISRLKLEHSVTMHGHLANPYRLLARADVLVLPSLSEGISRAALEALYLGVPCVLRSVDGNQELIHEGESGSLFKHDNDLAKVMIETVKTSRQRRGRRRILLPDAYRQAAGAHRYLALMEDIQ